MVLIQSPEMQKLQVSLLQNSSMCVTSHSSDHATPSLKEIWHPAPDLAQVASN